MLETRFPRPLGDVGHPQTFDFRVCPRVVGGATPNRVVHAADPALLAPFIDAARSLADAGCDAIATGCGFLARWQRELQAAVPVPVWTSSLLELQSLQSHKPPGRCGVITIDAAALTPALLQAVDADPLTPVEGITPGSALHRTLLEDRPTLDADDAVLQVLQAATRLRARHPEIDILVLECTNLPPYADALRRATGLRVHDVVTMLNRRMAGFQGSLQRR